MRRSASRSGLRAPFLRRVATIPEKAEAGRHSFTLPIFGGGGLDLDFRRPVTIFVGENGTGKSSLLEAIARNSGFNTQGGSRDNRYGTEEEDGGLAAALRFSWLPRVEGIFFRAESFFNFVDYVEAAYRADNNRVPPWGRRSLHHRSHGETFLGFFSARLGAARRCLYRFDEPEAALSADRQLEFLALMPSTARPAPCNASSRRTRRSSWPVPAPTFCSSDTAASIARTRRDHACPALRRFLS
ncbi:MAG TPA: AAA family ATPase [Stellaceae bacterium]|nr:AAA family ATPase [Stellaceae bacterium]